VRFSREDPPYRTTFAFDREKLDGRLRDSFLLVSVVTWRRVRARVHSEVRSQPDINISLFTLVLSLSCSGMRREQVPADVLNGDRVNRMECI